MANDKRKQNREVGTGRYTYEGQWERMCVCGHTLGVHSAVRLRDEETGKMLQDCLTGTGVEEDPALFGKFCDCTLFRPSRKKANG